MTARRSSRGQIHMNETLLVLFVLVILLFLGVFLYSQFFLRSIQESAGTLSEQESTLLLATISSLAELRCSDKPCLDTSKFLPFQSLVQQQRDHYVRSLGNQKISVAVLYPVPSSDDYCARSLYLRTNYPTSCSKWILYEQKPSQIQGTQIVSKVVSLYYPESNVYLLGRLTLEVYH